VSEREQKARRDRLEALRRAGTDPYPARVAAITRVSSILTAHEESDAESLEANPVKVAVAGRVMAIRSFGKLIFLNLREDGSSIQVSARKGDGDVDTFTFVRSLDVGDFVRVEGPLWRTRTEELTVAAHSVTLLAKSVRPLPEKWHGLTDIEARYRQRYLDLLVNERVREVAVARSSAISALRAFLDGRGFLEVETPILQPLYGGAAARPFVTHHNTYDQRLYLRISDELYLKRLVVGGLDRVYEIGRNFRNEGISRKHNPEFTMMECYQAFADYREMMDLAQAMIQHVTHKVLGRTQLLYQGCEIELGGSWPRRSLRDAILEFTGVDVLAAPDVEKLREAVRGEGLDPGEAGSWAKLVDDLLSTHVEPRLQQPAFLVDYPIELSPLAKRSGEDPRLAERFELFIAGMEIANAFSELNDPEDQQQRFEAQRRARAGGDEEAHPMDEDYVRALEHGLPPTGGLGVGIDRLVMILSDMPALREVVLFPHLRPERG
jgi:lysyl-tRNA synthetase class 2